MAEVQIDTQPERVRIICRGAWEVLVLEPAAEALFAPLALQRETEIVFDLAQITRLDTAGALLLHDRREALQKGGHPVRFDRADDEAARMLALTQRAPVRPVTQTPQRGPVEALGERTAESFYNILGWLGFIGETFSAFANLLLFKAAFRIKETVYQINESAMKALGIIALTMFLVGIVVAYQSAVQLKTYGANIFIVDALGISILRELAPMLTAVIVAGRSGSSFAAQIGVMKMTEEVDAMRTMGFDPFAFLVLPRLIALIIMMPILIFFADFFGLIGGMLIAHTELELSTSLFIERFVQAVPLQHFWVGIAKGPFFAVLIASIGIYRGLKVKNDTESIGINTTKSVVEAIFAVIICDAIFSIIFTQLGF